MSDRGTTVPGAPARSGPAANVRIRVAVADDAAAAARAIDALLGELGGDRPPTAALEEAARRLAADPGAGTLLIAEAGEEIVGVLATSWQQAIHVPGRYGTIQDLWVHPEWRSRALGRELVDAIVEIATELGITRLEVGLPQRSFAAIEATERFYLGNDFKPLGPRMRRLLR
jgi:branched-chain amino acid aminotransferase